MGSEPDVVGSAATATGDDIVAAGLFTLTGRSAATDSTVIGRDEDADCGIEVVPLGSGPPRPPSPRGAGSASSSPSARSGSTC